MSAWLERFEAHPVHTQLQALAELVAELLAKTRESEASESLDRVDQVRRAAERHLAASDPLLSSLAVMNGMQSHAKATVTELQQFRANGQAGHLANANTNADNLLTALAQLAPAASPPDLETLRDTTTSYRKSVGQVLRHIEVDRSSAEQALAGLKEQLVATKAEVDTQKARLDTAIAEFQRQFSDAEARRASEYASVEKVRGDAAAKLLQDWDESIDTDYQKWNGQVEGLVSSGNERLTAMLAKGALTHTEAVATLQASSDSALAGLDQHLKRAQELVYVIANTGMVGGYQKTALVERRSAVRWRLLTVLSMLGLAVFAVYAFVVSAAGAFSWGLFASRGFVAVCCGILAAYSARQADRHEEVERSARKVELALASINPYLEGMPEQVQQEIKREIALKVFAPAIEADGGKQAKVSGSAADLLRSALEAVNELAKK
jgi:hypothetical protein